MRRGLFLLLLLALPSCLTTSQSQLNGLLNHSIYDATTSFGKAPDSHVDLGHGQAVYTWRWPVAGTGPGGSISSQQMYEVVTLWTTDGVINQVQRQTE
jgi:hypothetical protein